METINARGPNFVYAQEYIINKYSKQTWEKILNELPEDAAEIWRGPIMVGGTYVMPLLSQAHFKIEAALC